MSAIGGIYNTNGAPIDQDLLGQINDIVDFRGPDGSGFWINGKIGLAHQLLWTTEESVNEKQPMTNGRGLWITADCRIDNREELKKEFEARGVWREANPPDCFYILLAYELWGEDAPNHLLGDFAFAIWDEPKQKLFCGRDPIGTKPFFYHWNGKKFIFGSEMKQIFQDSSVPEDLNVPHIADIVLMSYPHREETLYEAVQKLAPGHSIRIEKNSCCVKKYWDWHPDFEPPSHASVEENAEIFLHLFQDSVRARLRAPYGWRAGSLLSGGLDSSSIVSVAASISPTPFPVFTLCFPEANRDHQIKNMDWVDESAYVQDLVQKYGLELHGNEIRGWGPLHDLKAALWFQENPLAFPNLAYFQSLFRTVKNFRVRSLCHGEGGDEVFLVGSQCRFRELKKGKWGQFLKDFRGRREKTGGSYLQLVNSLCRTFTPEWLKVPYRKFFKKKFPDWIDPIFIKKYGLSERIRKDFNLTLKPHASSSYGILCWIVEGFAPYYLETFDRAGASAHLEIRYPFLDVRLLRFLATLPWDQKTRNGTSKFLLREALKNHLPASIQNRFRKTDFTPVVRNALETYASRELKDTFENPHALLRSMILPGKLQKLYKSSFFVKHAGQSDKIAFARWHLWYLTAVDQWLKHRPNFRKKIREDHNEKQNTKAVTTKEN